MTRHTALSPLDIFRLDLACKPIMEAFGEPPYLVGSTMTGETYRDVDVRLILSDDEFDRIIASQPLGAFLGMTIGMYLRETTGLPIDFQIQRRTQANEHHGGKPRNPMGQRSLREFKGDAA